MSIRLSRSGQEEDEDITSFWLITYSDMTTLLLSFFLLMFSFTLMTQERRDELVGMLNEVTSAKQVQDVKKKEELENAARDIAAQFKKDETFIESSEEEVTVGLSSSVTFDSGEAMLTEKALAPLEKVAGILVKMPNVIRVEGHTDDVPIRGGRFPSNWHLSAARAQSVVRLLMERGVDPKRLQVVGFGEVKPRQPNDTEAGRAANRRIEIKLLRQNR